MQSSAQTEKTADRSLKAFCEGLRGASLFSCLSDTEMAFFQDVARARSYKKGKVIFIEEEKAEFFYVICGGWVKLFHVLDEGEEVVVDMLTNGHMVGEGAIFENDFHTSSAQVVEDARLLAIPCKALKDRIRLNPDVAFGLISSMVQHHQRHSAAIALNAMQSAPQRIGCFLLKLCPHDKNKNISFDLPYDKALIAYTLGMKGATFSRALNILRMKTGIRVQGVHIEIDSIDQLMRFVYGPLAPKYMPKTK